MGDSAPTGAPEVDKRRTSRVARVLPLTVTGVDALGRSFHEDALTTGINCQGCRFRSKHYVLRNMWVTLEISPYEANGNPRRIRARVAWIQRPRTTRELFQIAVEFDTRGNVWGLSPAPPDWFPFPDSSFHETNLQEPQGRLPEIPAPPIPEPVTADKRAEVARLESAIPGDNEVTWPAANATPQPVPVPPANEPHPHDSNLRTMPLPASAEASSPLVEQMALLVEHARHDLQSLVQESVNEAVAGEAAALVMAVQIQLRNAAEQAAAAAVNSATEGAARHASETLMGTWREQWQHFLSESLEQAGRQWAANLAEIERERRANFERELDARKQQVLAELQQLALEHMRTSAEEIERGLEESCRMAAERWLTAIAKASDTTHSTFESLFRTADHYETRFRTQMQSLVKNTMDQVSTELNNKAMELSGLFATELGMYSRSYLDYTQGEIESAAKTAEARLTSICNVVFSAAGEALRQRLTNLTGS